MKSSLKSAVNRILNPLGRKVIRPALKRIVTLRMGSRMPSCQDRIAHAAQIGFNPASIIDCGAFKGSWTAMAHRIYKDAQFLVIEPNPHIQEDLHKNLATIQPSPIIEQKAVADQSGKLKFNIWGDANLAASASLQDHVKGQAEHQVEVDVTTIDDLIERHKIQPDLIKLDLQGAEEKALRGAAKALQSVEMFIVEFGCLEAYIDRATPHQLFDIFYDNGYCLYDIVELIYRPYDGALAGGDFFFVKTSSPLKKHSDYK